MQSRSANAALLGYYYQFDKTILSILNGNNTTKVTVEGLEDIDINNVTGTTVMQCKYLPSKKYSLAVLRPAIIFMLENFFLLKKAILIKKHFMLF